MLLTTMDNTRKSNQSFSPTHMNTYINKESQSPVAKTPEAQSDAPHRLPGIGGIHANISRLLSLMVLALAATLASAQTHPEIAGVTGNASVIGSCTPAGVAVFENRIHIRCSAAVSGFPFFAVSTADPQNALRFLNLFIAAKVNARPVNIFFDTADLSGAAFGCANADCRVVRGAEFF